SQNQTPAESAAARTSNDQRPAADLKSTETVDVGPQLSSLAEPIDPNGNEAGGRDAVPSICFGSDALTGTEVRWSLTVKGNPHLLVAGLPGMGKTTCLLSLCKQMITNGIRPIVFSYHQDIDERLERLVESVR